MGLTLRTNISPVVRLISNLLFPGLSASIPCPVKKYTMLFCRSLSPSVARTCEGRKIIQSVSWFMGEVVNLERRDGKFEFSDLCT